MKIAPIKGFLTTNTNHYTNKNKLSTNETIQETSKDFLIDKNYGKSLISFKANPKELKSLAEIVPLEDRLAAILYKSKTNDLIVAAPSLVEVQKGLRAATKEIEFLIKKIIFVKEENLDGCIGLSKTHGLATLWNFGKKPIAYNFCDNLAPNENFYMSEGDIITVGEREIRLLERPSSANKTSPNNIGAFCHLFSQTFDYSKETEKAIETHNRKAISQMVKAANGKSKRLTFANVGGQDKILEHLKENILAPIMRPDAFPTLPINHGTILYGKPGTGKSLIAEALANESNAYYKKLNGLELESKWVGESEANWRDLFNEAIENQPSIIFIDEFDAVARTRTGRNEYGDNVVNQLLTLMSDLEKDGDDVFIIAATNNYEALDPAIRRPGRFGHHLEVKAPDLDGVRQILKIHTDKRPIIESLDKEALAQKMFAKGYTGAEIAHIINTAHANAYKRLGIYEKIYSGDFKQEMMATFKITEQDFDVAFNNYKNDTRSSIGFKS